MKRLRAALASVSLIVLLAACSPGQIGAVLHARAEAVASGDTATVATIDQAVSEYNAVKAVATAGRPCVQWYDLAMDAGWDPGQWSSPLARIMNAESGCNPQAYNPSGATGLLQVLRSWARQCGTTPAGLFDPYTNLRCGKYVLDVSSWYAWSTY